MPLSPYVEEPLNSKVIKSFVPEQRSRKCFSCFEIPMFYLYVHSMYVSHIAISWLWYIYSVHYFLNTSPPMTTDIRIYCKKEVLLDQ